MTPLKQHLLDLAAGRVEPIDRSDGICRELFLAGFFPLHLGAIDFVCDHLAEWPDRAGSYAYPIGGPGRCKDKWANPRRLEACKWLAGRL